MLLLGFSKTCFKTWVHIFKTLLTTFSSFHFSKKLIFFEKILLMVRPFKYKPNPWILTGKFLKLYFLKIQLYPIFFYLYIQLSILTTTYHLIPKKVCRVAHIKFTWQYLMSKFIFFILYFWHLEVLQDMSIPKWG